MAREKSSGGFVGDRLKVAEPEAAGPETESYPDAVMSMNSDGLWERSVRKVPDEDTASSDLQRQLFRCFSCKEAEGPREVCTRLHHLCRQWLNPENYTKVQILDQLILEQFLTILPSEIQTWVKEHPLESSTQAVSLAEEFLHSQCVPGVKEEQVRGNGIPIVSRTRTQN